MHDVHELGGKMPECHGSGTGQNTLSLLTSSYIFLGVGVARTKVLISKHASRSSWTF